MEAKVKKTTSYVILSREAINTYDDSGVYLAVPASSFNLFEVGSVPVPPKRTVKAIEDRGGYSVRVAPEEPPAPIGTPLVTSDPEQTLV